MLTDLEQLVLSISADNRQMLRVLKKLEGDTSATTRKVEKLFDQMAKRIDARLSGIGSGSFKNVLGGVTAALGAGAIVEMTNVWTDLTSRVNLAAGSMDKGEEVMGRLGEMARRTYSALEQTAESYIDNSTALKELGYATDDQLNYTEALNNALVISAAKGQRAEAVQNALAKAMAGGKLQGENLNTVIEQGGRVAEALAAGLGVGVNQLRALGAQGKITSRDVFKALTSQMETLRKEAEEMPATIADGFQLLRNALLEYVGNADQATGVSRKISDALVVIADNFDKTADVALQLAGVIAGALVGRSLAVMIAKLGLGTKAILSFIRALTAARAAGGLAAAFGGLGAAAGPAGLIVGGALVAALTLFSGSSTEASEAARIYAKSLEEVRAKAEKAAEGISEVSSSIDARAINGLTLALQDAEKELGSAKTSVFEFIDALTGDYAMSFATPEQKQQLEELRKGLDAGTVSAEDAAKAIFAMANADYNFQIAADKLAPLLDALGLAISQVDNLRSKIAATSGTGPSWADSERASMSALADMQAANQSFIDSQTKQNALSKEQLAIETEIAKVKKEAVAAGAVLTDKQIRDLATANVTANERRSKEGKKTPAPKKTADDRFDNLTQGIYDRIDAMKLEQATLGATFYEQQKRTVSLDLEQEALKQVREEARRKGDQDWQNAQLSPSQVKQIDEVSDSYARQADELRKAQDAQDLQRDVLKGVFSDMRSALDDGKLDWNDLANVAMNALDKIVDKIENDLIDAILQASSAGGSGGGILGAIGSLFGMQMFPGGMGVADPGGFAKMLGFASGTANTGGQRGQPIGVVHGQEAVIPLPNGGKVPVQISGPMVPDMPRLVSNRNGNSQSTVRLIMPEGWKAEVVNEARSGSRQDAVRIVQDYDRGMPARVQQISADPRLR